MSTDKQPDKTKLDHITDELSILLERLSIRHGDEDEDV